MSTPPLDGVRVLDLSWVMVGPMTGRYLADLGADVVKVESSTRIDPLRTLGPFTGAPNDRNSISYQFINAGKRSIAIDLRRDEGRTLALELVSRVDVLLQSYTPGVMERLGLDDSALFAANPRLIYASTSVFGNSGPRTQTSGVGTIGAAYSGAAALVGWPDRPPTGPFGPWTDAVAPRYIAAAILAALHRVRRTGAGCRIDVAQAEAGLQFVLPEYLAWVVNGESSGRMGSQLSRTRVPSGIYPSRGNDRWVAIDVCSAAQWEALAQVVGRPLHDAHFATLLGRLRARDRIDEALAGWTSARTPEDTERILQEHGVPAHAVTHAGDLGSDPDLAADQYYVDQRNEDLGEFAIRRAQCEITPAATVPPIPATATGESTREVLTGTFGYSTSEVERLADSGVLR